MTTAKPSARYGATWGARAAGFATAGATPPMGTRPDGGTRSYRMPLVWIMLGPCRATIRQHGWPSCFGPNAPPGLGLCSTRRKFVEPVGVSPAQTSSL